MKKEEILERSRKEKKDEIMDIFNKTANHTGLIFGDILFFIFFWLSNNISVNRLFFAVIGAQVFGECGYRFLKQKKAEYLIISLIGLITMAYGSLLFFNII